MLTKDSIVTLDALSSPIWIYDTLNYGIAWANKSALTLWESEDLTELCSRDFRPTSSEAVQQVLLSYLQEFKQGKKIKRWWRIAPKGNSKDVFCQFSGIRLEDGHMAMLVEGIEADILDLERSEKNSAIVSLHNKDGSLISANPSFNDQFGFLINNFQQLMVNPIEADALLRRADQQQIIEIDCKVKTTHGTRWHSIEVRKVDSEPSPHTFVITQHDVHDRKIRELKAAEMASTDHLTGILNRNGLENHFKEKLNNHRPAVFFYVDLDGFKPVNDTFGHATGDVVLRQVAQRLKDCVSAGSTPCRIGGDEFLLIVREDMLGESLDKFANGVIQLLSKPYSIKGKRDICISASVGVSRYPEDGTTIGELLVNADSALYLAKNRGRRRWIRYQNGMESHLRRRSLLAQKLPAAIEQQELKLVYQPIMDARSGSIIMVESLLRWSDESLGEISAGQTIEIAEEIGLVSELGFWCLQKTSSDLLAIKETLGHSIRATINISGLHLMQDFFLERFCEIMAQSSLEFSDIMLELTESNLVSSLRESETLMAKLVEHGVEFAIDDFGTGHSSLAYLQTLPVTHIKIDKAFVDRLSFGSTTIENIHRLIAQLGMTTIAEGVETLEQVQTLLNNDINLHQGYYYTPPLALDDLLIFNQVSNAPTASEGIRKPMA